MEEQTRDIPAEMPGDPYAAALCRRAREPRRLGIGARGLYGAPRLAGELVGWKRGG